MNPHDTETVVGDSEIFSYVSRFHYMCCVEEVSDLVKRPVVFCQPNDGTSAQVATQRVHLELPQPQTAKVFSVMTGIWTPMIMTKKVCQRPTDQDSSLR